jgi:hypothetical protein
MNSPISTLQARTKIPTMINGKHGTENSPKQCCCAEKNQHTASAAINGIMLDQKAVSPEMQPANIA